MNRIDSPKKLDKETAVDSISRPQQARWFCKKAIGTFWSKEIQVGYERYPNVIHNHETTWMTWQ